MTARHQQALLILRLSIALLMLVWGADKIANPGHGAIVAERFYFGLLSARSIMPALGLVQIALGLLVAAGLWRRYAYPVLAAVTGLTLVGSHLALVLWEGAAAYKIDASDTRVQPQKT